MRIRYTRQAISDISAIAAYIRARNPSAAADVETAFRSTIALLSDHPQIGGDRPDLDARALRIPRYPYTAYYRIEEEEIWIVHIRDDRRKPPERGEL